MWKMKIKTWFFINKVMPSSGTRKEFCESRIPDQSGKEWCLTSKQGHCSNTQTSTLESCQIIITASHTKTWWLISRSVLLMGCRNSSSMARQHLKCLLERKLSRKIYLTELSESFPYWVSSSILTVSD